MTSLRTCTIFIRDVPIGTLAQTDDGRLTFAYEPAYGGVPLSLSMPVANTVYGDKIIRPYLFGLLPDDPRLRSGIGREFGVSGENPFALLRFIGRDCPGAVRIIPTDVEESLPHNESPYRPISEKEIEKRLKHLNGSGAATWQAPAERWSLGGQQAKIALARFVHGGETSSRRSLPIAQHPSREQIHRYGRPIGP